MKRIVVVFFVMLAAIGPLAAVWAGTDAPGEFSIRSVQPLTEEQLARLRRLVQADVEAAALAAAVRQAAEPLLAAQPRPLEAIHYEGLVNTDPRRIATVAQLREMDDVAAVVRYWQVSDDPSAAAMLERFILAWARTYRPTGNDVNENKLYPLLVAYFHLRHRFPPDDQKTVDAWLRDIGERHARAVQSASRFTNRYTKRVRLLSILGRILGEVAWAEMTEMAIQRFVTHGLKPDGRSVDLIYRDTLTYHNSALVPILELAINVGRPDLYDWESPDGSSIRRSVEYVVPYATGEKTREEWRNTTVQLDRRRAEAGLEAYRPGRLFDPQDALELMELAAYFDPALLRVVLHLTGSPAKRFPTWQTLVNAACQP